MRKSVVGHAAVLPLLFFYLSPADAISLHDCRVLTDKTQRLNCYDALPADPEPSPPDSTKPALDERLRVEKDLTRRSFLIMPHRPSYLLHTYSSTPNVTPFLAEDPDTTFQRQELKFQISLRVPVWDKLFGDNGDLWFAYTQVSFWQAYNLKRSSPFRETNYEPELGLTFHTDFSWLGIKQRLISVGFSHQSNGRSDPISRSWNRVWTEFVLEHGNLVFSLKPWYRIPEPDSADNNSGIENYMGRGELHVAYKHDEQVYSLLLHNNLRTSNNRSGYELDWSLPINKRAKGLVQYFNGYGESLIDYDVRMRRIGVGVLISDWL